MAAAAVYLLLALAVASVGECGLASSTDVALLRAVLEAATCCLLVDVVGVEVAECWRALLLEAAVCCLLAEVVGVGGESP